MTPILDPPDRLGQTNLPHPISLLLLHFYDFNLMHFHWK